MKNYTESLEYMRALTKFGFNFGLDRVVELLRRLGNPHETMKYIHVGGTNGKGSITSILNSMLIAAGETPGMFTSPHLHSYRERFRIGGEMISHDDVAMLLNEIKPHIEAMMEDGFEQPTEFEVNTVMAFFYFAKKGLKTAVMEVGMGGEIDATNVISDVKVAVLTNIALEHTEYLGKTTEAICTTKSGIIKKNCQVVTGITEDNLLDIVNQQIKTVGAKDLSIANRDFSVYLVKESALGQWFNYSDAQVEYKELFIPFQGKHQVSNAGIAIRAALLWGLEEEAIRQGLKKAIWPCRLETVSLNPVTIIDGAHNDHGMTVLTQYLTDHYSDKKITVLIGMLADKEREKAIALLGPLAEQVVVTKPNSDRAGDYEMIAKFFEPYCEKIYLEEKIPDGCKLAQSLTKSMGEDGLLLITGSLYMVADARGYILGIESE